MIVVTCTRLKDEGPIHQTDCIRILGWRLSFLNSSKIERQWLRGGVGPNLFPEINSTIAIGAEAYPDFGASHGSNLLYY